jgi:predicted dehydrogenase
MIHFLKQAPEAIFPLFCVFAWTLGMTSARAAEGPPPGSIRLIVLDPGHFHAGLLQKTMYPGVDPVVHVYSPDSDDILQHLQRVSAYNRRADHPTDWREAVYVGPDYFERMLREKSGNVVVISGNNIRKMDYIEGSIGAGLNVFADKPMAIDPADFARLRGAFAEAKAKGVVLYDIMTERSEIPTILQREFSRMPDIFGQLQTGTADNPAVRMESTHFYFKQVSGVALTRPAWFFDIRQQGEGLVDVGTHLVDLVQWECFPEQVLDYARDIRVLAAKHWPTRLVPAQFESVTGLKKFPDFLESHVSNGALEDYANGSIDYVIKGVHARITVHWAYRAPGDSGDTHFSILRGTKCSLIILQGPEENFQPTLYIEAASGADPKALAAALAEGLPSILARYPGVGLERHGRSWKVLIPQSYYVGHEAHFAQVTERFLGYVAAGRVPDWEEAGMLAKYYTTTTALEMARRGQ